MVLFSIFLGIISLIFNSMLIFLNMLQTLTFNDQTILLGVFSLVFSSTGLVLAFLHSKKTKNNEKKKTLVLTGFALCGFNFLLSIYWICVVANI